MTPWLTRTVLTSADKILMSKTEIILTGCVYTPNALRETIEAFSSLCDAAFTTTEDDSLLVELRFLEREQQPSDALPESSLRRSLVDESRIPIFWYGSVEFDAAPAFAVRLMTSRP